MRAPQELAGGQKTIGQLRYRLRAEASYAVVTYEGSPDTITVADAWQRDIDAFLRASQLSRVVWDSRAADPLIPAVRAHIWAWLTRAEVVKASAIIVKSELLRVSGNMSSVGGHLRLRSFHTFENAVEWLLQQRI